MSASRTKWRYVIVWLVLVPFAFLTVSPPRGYADVLNLPAIGEMVMPSQSFIPVLLKGMTLYPQDPLRFDFIIDSGQSALNGAGLKAESERLIKYFLTSMTVPGEDLWVNLSPHEKNRIIPDALGRTVLGRDLLAQDYLLKQFSASLIHPGQDLGHMFWERVYKKARQQFGTTDIPMNTFNKVWILPDKASVYEDGYSVYVTDSHLKVMLDEDYQALENSSGRGEFGADRIPVEQGTGAAALASGIMRDLIIPEIEREINEGETFARIRQIYHSLILAQWYKDRVRESLLNRAYINRNMVIGVESGEDALRDRIYDRYMAAYKQGVFSFIKEDDDELGREAIPRKYFSGGFTGRHIQIDQSMLGERDSAREPAGERLRAQIALTPQTAAGRPINRREFLKRIGLSAIGLAAGPAGAPEKKRSETRKLPSSQKKSSDQALLASREEALRYQQTVAGHFRQADAKVLELLDPAISGKDNLAARPAPLKGKRGETLFVNAPLAQAGNIREVFAETILLVQNMAERHRGRDKNSYMDLDEIHLTASTAEFGPAQLAATQPAIAQEVQEDSREGVGAFEIRLLGPHLMPNRAVVMEYEITSPEFLTIRMAVDARNQQRVVAEGNQSFTPDIYHSSVLFLSNPDMSLEELADLNAEFASIRERLRQNPVTARIDTLAVSRFNDATRKKIGTDILINLAPSPSPAGEKVSDQAVLAEEQNQENPLGGIDMNRIEVDRQGEGPKITFDPVKIENMMPVDGFTPVILDLSPLPGPMPVLGRDPGLLPEKNKENDLLVSRQ